MRIAVAAMRSDKPMLSQRPVVDGRITEIAHQGGHNATVNVDTGAVVPVDILFAHPRNTPSASLHEPLGLDTITTR
ncbi:hypothetical protein FHR55_001561 [Xanthomonas arboricola]